MIKKYLFRAVRRVTDFYGWHFHCLTDMGREALAWCFSMTIICLTAAAFVLVGYLAFT